MTLCKVYTSTHGGAVVRIGMCGHRTCWIHALGFVMPIRLCLLLLFMI